MNMTLDKGKLKKEFGRLVDEYRPRLEEKDRRCFVNTLYMTFMKYYEGTKDLLKTNTLQQANELSESGYWDDVHLGLDSAKISPTIEKTNERPKCIENRI